MVRAIVVRFEICLDPRQTSWSSRGTSGAPIAAASAGLAGRRRPRRRTSEQFSMPRSSIDAPCASPSAAAQRSRRSRLGAAAPRPGASWRAAAGRLPQRGSTYPGRAAAAAERPGSARGTGPSVGAELRVRLAPPGSFSRAHRRRAAHRDLEPWLCQKMDSAAESKSVSMCVRVCCVGPFGCQPAPSGSPPGVAPSLTPAAALCLPEADESANCGLERLRRP